MHEHDYQPSTLGPQCSCGAFAPDEGLPELPRYQTSHRFIATYTGPTEFYSGIQTGDRVLVVEEVIVYTFRGERRCAVSASIQRLDGGPWLVLHNATANLSDITEED